MMNSSTILKEIESSSNKGEIVCNCCEKRFNNPLLATFASDDSSEKYYACPKCLSKISEIEPKKPEKRIVSPELEIPQSSKETSEGDGKCSHFLGYLNRRAKNIPIPEACLTCEDMIKCLYG
jgi:hypothetical protein